MVFGPADDGGNRIGERTVTWATAGLKPIETRYHGYRFRSRLEARWAVFFDTLKVPFDYETEGFDLGASGLYLPDFWLPEQTCWAEIRPREASEDPRCAALRKVTGRRVLYITGSPWPGDYSISLLGEDRDVPYVFALGRRGRRTVCLLDPEGGNATWLGPPQDDGERYPLDDCPELQAAYRAARGARFEHA